MNQMFMERKVTTQKKHGVIVYLHKTSEPTTPADFRPVTLLNTDYKILARSIVYRLRLMMTELLQPTQFCGVPGKTIFRAVASVRKAIAQAKVTRAPLSVISLDFQEAFVRISHQHLFAILRNYGFSSWFIERIKCLYDDTVSSVQINGHIEGLIQINS